MATSKIDFGVIAAGDGLRIKAEGSYMPKPMLEIRGMPMIWRLIKIMENSGANSVSVVVNSDMPEVIEYLQEQAYGLTCDFRIKSCKTPSSMHSFYELLQLMKPEDKFVITTVDTIFRENNFKNYINFFRNSPHDIDGVMGVTTHIDDESPLYVEIEDRHRIVGFSDSPVEGGKYISAGVYGLHTSAFPILQECIDSGKSRMRNFQRQLIKRGLNIDAYDLGVVLDVDHLSDVEKANSFLD